jgi:hypothetical protein
MPSALNASDFFRSVKLVVRIDLLKIERTAPLCWVGPKRVLTDLSSGSKAEVDMLHTLGCKDGDGDVPG